MRVAQPNKPRKQGGRDGGENPRTQQRVLLLPIGERRIFFTGLARSIREENWWNLRRNDITHHFCSTQNSFNLLLPLKVVRIVELDRYDLFESFRSCWSDTLNSIVVHLSFCVMRRNRRSLRRRRRSRGHGLGSRKNAHDTILELATTVDEA